MVLEQLSRLFLTKLCLANCKNVKSFTTTSTLFSTQTKPTRLPHGYNAPTPYSLFAKENIEGRTGERVTEAMKRVATDWKNLSNEQKQVYYDNSNQIKAEKRAEFESLPDDKKQDLLLKNVERIEKRKHRSHMRKVHEFKKSTNKPKHPLTSYMLFVKDTFDKTDQKPKGKDELSKFAANAGEIWNKMSAEEKKPYEDRGMQLKEEYRNKLAEWKENNKSAIKDWEDKQKEKTVKRKIVKQKETDLATTAEGEKHKTKTVKGKSEKKKKNPTMNTEEKHKSKKAKNEQIEKK